MGTLVIRKPSTRDTEISIAEARRLLKLTERARWVFPSSGGRPVRWGDLDKGVEKVMEERDVLAKAAASFQRNGRVDLATEIAANSWRVWVIAKEYEAGRRLLAQVLDNGPREPTRAVALALYGDSLLALRQGKTKESRKRSEDALKVAELVGDREALALANLALSRIAFEDEDYQQSLSLARTARRFSHTLHLALAQAPLFMEAQSQRMLGNYDEAAVLLRMSVELNERIGDKGMVMAELNNLGLVEIHRNRIDSAERLFAESEKISGRMKGSPYGRGMALLNEAMVADGKGQSSKARSLLTKAKSTFKQARIEPASDDKFEFDWLERKLKGMAG